MKIIMKHHGRFTGAVSKKIYQHEAGKTVDLVDPKDALHLDKKDYTVLEEPVELNKLKKDELIALAEERKIDVPSGATRDEILDLLQPD